MNQTIILKRVTTVLLLVIAGCTADKETPPSSSGPNTHTARTFLVGEDLVINSGLQTLDGEQVYDNISVINGGTLQVTPYNTMGTTGRLFLRARVSITVDGTSSIYADGAGYPGGAGIAAGGEPGDAPPSTNGGGGGATVAGGGGGGGGHAGAGHVGTPNNNCAGTASTGGSAYGSASVTDATMGAGGGGGRGNGAGGGTGGGILVLSAPSITIEGTVSANGDDGTFGGNSAGGGGAGGSVIVVADNFICNGTLGASGGIGNNQNDDGGGGSGGWVKVAASTSSGICIKVVDGGATGNCGSFGDVGQTPTTSDGLVAVYCGNNTIEPWEGCDDGGNADGDGCHSSCLSEPDSLAYPCEYPSQCTSSLCTGSEGEPGVCANCLDDATGTSADTGCSGGTPFCDTSSGTTCVASCQDDTSGNTDTGCTGSGSGATNACDESGSNPMCVDCTERGDCNSGDACHVASHTCVTGCINDDDCEELTPHCDLSHGTPGVCVECIAHGDCTDLNQICYETECKVDSDHDGIPDDRDDDPDASSPPDAAPSLDAGKDGGPESAGSSGCSVSRHEPMLPALTWLLLALVGWLIVRERDQHSS